jgi:hypothetical protein
VAMGPVEVPPEIREAEGKTPAASGRGLRFAAFAVLGALAVATGVIYLGSALGFEAVDDLADALVPFDNLYLGLAVDGGVITTCVWLWRQEETTREENVQRIWAEVQRRRAAPAKGKKEVGFKKKRKASRPGAATAASSSGFGSSPAPPEAAAAAPPAAPPPPPPPPPPAAPPPEPPAGGFQKMWDEMYEQADSLGRAQALSLNSALEDRGVLPKLQTPEEGSASAAAPDAASAPPAPAPAPVADAGVAAAEPASSRRPKKSSKSKKKKKR